VTLTVGSLFSGIGGLELGLEWAGMRTLWQVEKSAYCRAQLAKHWPDVVRYADVKDVGSHNLAPVDIICGGFPCQDISYAGKGAGLTGHRSGLWSEFARIIGEMEPRYAIVENVPALLTRGIDQVLGTLADLGYDAEWRTISAADVGAPHLRKRLFIMAYANRERGRSLLRGGNEEQGAQAAGSSASVGMAHTDDLGSARHKRGGWEAEHGTEYTRDKLGNTNRTGLVEQRQPERLPEEFGSAERRGQKIRGWADATPVRGADGTIRLIPREAAEAGPQSSLWPVADGIPGRVARLSAIGNAVVPEVAEQVGYWVQQLERSRSNQ
jgi:DNA (cytosine-5)-methyltransferase 1